MAYLFYSYVTTLTPLYVRPLYPQTILQTFSHDNRYEKEYNDKIMHRYKAGAGAGEEGKFNDTELGYAGPDDMGYVASAGGAPLGMQPKELNEREARRQRRMEREQKRERREEKRR